VETNHTIFDQENENLQLTLESLDKLIKEYSYEPGKTDLREFYNQVGGSDFEVFVSCLPNLLANNKNRIEMKKSPYFGRIDIYENGKPKTYYIGSRSEWLDHFRILDWKSTLSQLFYVAESEGYFEIEFSEETRRIPVFQKFNIKILNSKLQDVVILFSKDPTRFDKDKIIKPAINYRDIQRKPAKQVSQKDAPSISSSINREHIKDKIKSSKIIAKPAEKKIESSTNRPISNNVKPNRFLTSELESRGDPKFHTIYRTFQAEQFRIVRLPSDRALIVNGVAGSGKTSIGYHRLAYLSFEERTTVLESNKMLVFGPNKLFLSFIRELLPSLETQGVYETTFEDWALQRLGLGYQDSDGRTVRTIEITDKASDLFLSPTTPIDDKRTLWRRSRIKGSLQFGNAIKEIIENGILPCPIQDDLTITTPGKNPVVRNISRETILNIWGRLKSSFSIEEKLNAFVKSITQEINTTTNITVKSNKIGEINDLTIEDVKAAVKLFFTLYPITIYSEVINNRRKFYNQFKKFSKPDLEILGSFIFDKKTVDLEDLAGILYIKLLINPASFSKYSHIVIDEGQDFSPIHYVVFNKISQKQSLTILGDIAQGIVAHRGLKNWDELDAVFNNVLNENLQISYRTTYEITELANEVLHKVYGKKMVSAIPYPRPGKKPKLQIVSLKENLFRYLVNELSSIGGLSKVNTGILTKGERDAIDVFQHLSNRGINSQLILKRDQTFNLQKGISILPINLSKGLEFEKAILFNVSKENFDDFVDYDGRLLYVGVTRALHELFLISLGEPTKLLKESKFIEVYNDR